MKLFSRVFQHAGLLWDTIATGFLNDEKDAFARGSEVERGEIMLFLLIFANCFSYLVSMPVILVSSVE